LLLDTYALIYALARPDELRESARHAIADPENEAFFTPANVWQRDDSGGQWGRNDPQILSDGVT